MRSHKDGQLVKQLGRANKFPNQFNEKAEGEASSFPKDIHGYYRDQESEDESEAGYDSEPAPALPHLEKQKTLVSIRRKPIKKAKKFSQWQQKARILKRYA